MLSRKNYYRISFINFCNSLPVVLCGCGSWSFTLGEGRRLRVFENSPKRDEVTGVIKLHKGELNDLYSSPKIDPMMKSRRICLAGHVAHMGREVAYTGFWWRNLKEKDHMGDPDIDGRIILRWIFRNCKWGCGLDRTGSR